MELGGAKQTSEAGERRRLQLQQAELDSMLGITLREGEMSLGIGNKRRWQEREERGRRPLLETAGDPEDRAVDGEGEDGLLPETRQPTYFLWRTEFFLVSQEERLAVSFHCKVSPK